MTPPDAARAGLLAALASAAAFGLNAPFAPLAAAVGISGPDLVFWRVPGMLLAGVALALALRRPLRVPRAAWPGVAALALATATTTIAYITAVTRIPVGVAVIVFYTFPLFILLATPIVERERLGPFRLGIFALAFAGLAIALGPRFSGLDTLGLALAGLAACATATQIFVGSRVTQKVEPVALVFWVHVGVLPIAFTVAVLTGGPVGPAVLALAPLAVGINVVAYVTGYLLQIRAVRLGRPAAVGLAYTLEPVVSIATAAVVLGERLTLGQYLGAALVLAAIAASVLRETPRSPSP